MLSRTASNLYWIGRYMERAEFTTRLVEATIRLSSLSPRSQCDAGLDERAQGGRRDRRLRARPARR